jgi:SAM-dependent methyltransferase
VPLDSAFDPDKIAAAKDTYYEHRAGENERKQRFPGLGMDLQTDDADALVNRLLSELSDQPAGAVGEGSGGKADGLVIGAGFRVASVVGDVTGLPVADASQDFVLCEQLLEHVLDPLVASREIERVLRPGGIALIKVPFNYPWHGGFIDFYRFTPAGYLAAFHRLEVVHIGHGPGPASTITYALQQAITSLFTGRTTRRAAVVIGRLTFGPWRHLDRVLVTRSGSLSSSCSLIFIGRRVAHERSPVEVIAQAKALGTARVVGPANR